MLSPSAADRAPRSAHVVPQEVRRRLEQERTSRQAQLHALVDGGTGADAGFQTAQGVSVRDVLAAVEAALTRVEEGTYGLCETCSHPVPAERLEALPHARRCIDCQRRAG